MKKIKIAIIGAGSSYTPVLIEGLVNEKDKLPVDEIALTDINQERLGIMANFCRRFLKHLKHPIKITTTTARREAIAGASFVVVQIRVGGNAQRVFDEKIPLKYGIIGQETTGPGGMMKALRTIPVMLEIAKDVEQYNTEAWIINYTNPAGLVTEAVNNYTRANIAGLCSGGLFPKWYTSQALGVPAESIDYIYVGLNHLNFAFNITTHGRPLTDQEFDRVAEVAAGRVIDPVLIKNLRLIPSPYLQYYFHTARTVKEAQAKERSRGEEVQMLEAEVFSAYADESCDTKPAALAKRGGGGYSEVALGMMKSIYNNEATIIIVNIPNRGVIKGLPDEAVVEIPGVVNAAGVFGLTQPDVPKTVWGLIAAVKNYEQLTVEAAVTGCRNTSLLALLAHPLVQDYAIARPMLEELLEANRRYLPQFFK
jgi:6-phospho-beta-glucosidase